MYDFIDVTETAENSILPSEAMKLNGEYIENQIKGYRTLHVSGREALSPELNSYETGVRDGSSLKSKRFPARTIVITYQLAAGSSEEFREAYNKLGFILNVKDAELIFNDEPDRYYTGTPSLIGEVEPGRNTVTGEIEIFCADPFKYSCEEYVISPDQDDGKAFAVNYEGTYKAYPVLEATMNGDNGFVGFLNDKGYILQFGSVDEADGENYQRSEKLLTIKNFMEAPDDTDGTEIMHPDHGVKGTLTTSTWFSTPFLSLGTAGEMIGAANGGLRTLQVPADSEGRIGAKNFDNYLHLIFYAGLMGQTGEMTVTWLTEKNEMIAGLCWYKTDMTGNTGHYELWANGKMLQTYAYTTSHLHEQNPWFWDWGHCALTKEGSRLTFFYYGGYPEFVVPEVENMECAKIQVAIKQWGDRSGDKLMSFMGIDTFDFYKLNVDKWRNIPNKFSDGNLLSVNCRTGEVTLKGLPKSELGALGNDWENFCLLPQKVNQVKCVCSEWAKNPTYRLKYREVFL